MLPKSSTDWRRIRKSDALPIIFADIFALFLVLDVATVAGHVPAVPINTFAIADRQKLRFLLAAEITDA